MYKNELYHFGVKGMKWGVRKKYPISFSNKNKSNGSEKNNQKKSKRREKLEAQYRSLGMSKKDAEIQADKRIKVEKAIATVAAVTVATCAAMYVNKKILDKTDGLIKAGDSLRRIEMQDTNGKLHDIFYASMGEHDNKRYHGLLGFNRQCLTGRAYTMKLEALNDIKVASKDKAAKAFGELYKNDSNFRKSVKPIIETFPGGNKITNPDNFSNKNIRKMYDNFNAGLLYIRDSGSGADKQFFAALKKKGYGAIQDINDIKFSGYKSKNPLIIFDNPDSKNIIVRSTSEIKNDLFLSRIKEKGKARVEAMLDDPVLIGGGVAGAAVIYMNEDVSKTRVYDKKTKRIYVR